MADYRVVRISFSCIAMSWLFCACSAVAQETTDNSLFANNQPIQLSRTITTSPQRGLTHTKDKFPRSSRDEPSVVANRFLRHILQSTRNGTSNIFLVDAKDARYALSASLKIVAGTESTDTPVRPNGTQNYYGNFWLVVYLGVGSPDSPSWVVDNVDVGDDTITLAYHTEHSSTPDNGDQRYFYWVQLGKLRSGDYQVQLVDSQANATTLLRRISVPE